MKLFFLIWLIFTFTGPLWNYVTGRVDFKADYRTANRSSAHIAPDPATEKAAVIQVYAARAFNWRGLVASHCWISIKQEGAAEYTVYQVVGWRIYGGLPALAIEQDIPDRYWYNEKPRLILDIRGDRPAGLIPKIEAAVETYPYSAPYKAWPGPNSNTFPAYIARKVPELGLALPSDALGKDFLPEKAFFARAPSGTGYQLSFDGVLGVLLAWKEGFELNILGLVYGVKFSPFSFLLPGLGMTERPNR